MKAIGRPFTKGTSGNPAGRKPVLKGLVFSCPPRAGFFANAPRWPTDRCETPPWCLHRGYTRLEKEKPRYEIVSGVLVPMRACMVAWG